MDLREVVARASVLQQSAASAQERAAAARHRVPELEAQKKAAAAARVCLMGHLFQRLILEMISRAMIGFYIISWINRGYLPL